MFGWVKPAAPPLAPAPARVPRPLVPPAAIDLVRASEGCVLRAYADPGPTGLPVTVGVGCTRNEAGQPWRLGDVIDQARADALLARDMGATAQAIDRLVAVPISEQQRAALISFAFNEGVGAFASSTMLRLLNSGQARKAADQFPIWDLSHGQVLPGLVTRRARERLLFLSGKS